MKPEYFLPPILIAQIFMVGSIRWWLALIPGSLLVVWCIAMVARISDKNTR